MICGDYSTSISDSSSSGARLLLGTLSTVDRVLRAHLGLLGAPLRGRALALNALAVLPRSERVLVGPSSTSTGRGLDADELALMFLDIVPGWLPDLLRASLISPTADTALRDLETVLLDMTQPQSDPALFAHSALATSPSWQNVRTVARRVLEAIDAVVPPPRNPPPS